MNYKEYNDYELLNYIAEKSEEANNILFKKYEPLIYKKAKSFEKYIKNTSLDLNDLIQEGMIGFNSAIENFNNSKETMFYTYAELCIERRIISLIIASTRNKHRILNESVSYDIPDSRGNYANIDYIFKDTKNPETILLDDEFINEVTKKAENVLTPLEMNVFSLKINGFDYKEIADILDKDVKAIDNALQRIKRKLIDLK